LGEAGGRESAGLFSLSARDGGLKLTVPMAFMEGKKHSEETGPMFILLHL
jgi:hypothetical protein